VKAVDDHPTDLHATQMIRHFYMFQITQMICHPYIFLALANPMGCKSSSIKQKKEKQNQAL